MIEPYKILDEDDGYCPFLFVSDHAGRAIPQHLGDLGLQAQERERHIGWDIGIDKVGEELVSSLHGTLIEQYYSRLVIDCNRAPNHPTSIVAVSDGTEVPGNQGISDEEIAWRQNNILHAYHDCIARFIEARQKQGRSLFIVSLHSFTPKLRSLGAQEPQRPWDVGILSNRDRRASDIMIALLKEEGLCVGDNQPYALTDISDYTIPHQAERRSLPYLEIEIRQDHLQKRQHQQQWARLLARLLPRTWEEFCRFY